MHHWRDLAVITPTPCRDLQGLGRCLLSVRDALDHLVLDRGIRGHHYVVLDLDRTEEEEDPRITSLASEFGVTLLALPHATGRDGWNGHRIYAAVSWLVPQRYISFLDDDNEVERSHYVGLFDAIGRVPGAKWAHSLRTVVSPDGFACRDSCESLGIITHSVIGENDFLVDTNCYMIETILARDLSGLWNARARDETRPEVDRALASALVRNFRGAVSRAHSVKYRTSSRPDSVALDFFSNGNGVRKYDFLNKDDIYVFWMHPVITGQAIVHVAARSDAEASYAYDEWNVSQLRELGKRYNLLNGYACSTHLPYAAKVVVALCFPEPIDALAGALKRSDLDVVVYTAEGPNYRHKEQWTRKWLEAQFGERPKLLTYFEPFLKASWCATTFVPHNCHHYSDADLANPSMMIGPRPVGDRSVVIVLEPRLGAALYSLDDDDGDDAALPPLHQLDHLRYDLLRGLRATVVGKGWKNVADRDPEASGRWRLVETDGKAADKQTAFEYYSRHQFAIVIENCDGRGYVSEKIYDVLAAGCIPLFYDAGNARTPEMAFLRDMFVDIGGCASGSDVANVIDALSDTDVWELQRKIVSSRPDILRRVGASTFADALTSSSAFVVEEKNR